MHPSARKVADAAARLGLDIEIVAFQETTHSAADAAAAIGCSIGQIVKSLYFDVGGEPVMVLVSGANQLDTRKLARLTRVSPKQIARGEPERAKAATGFTIGGIPPFGHETDLPIYIDEDLLQYDSIWAAAGTPHAVFEIAPATLVRAAAGRVANLRLESG